MYARCSRSLTALEAEAERWLGVVERCSRGARIVASDVSGWSIPQHVDHIASATLLNLKAAVALSVAALEHDPDLGTNEPGPKLVGLLILATGRIPRGADAPTAVLPAAEPALQELRARILSWTPLMDELRPQAQQLDAVRRRIPHPLLGGFDPRQWLRFALLHSRHHARIVARIERAAR